MTLAQYLPAAVLSAAILFSGIVAAFTFVQKFTSKAAKADLAKYLRSVDFGVLHARLPVDTQRLLGRAFGDSQLTLRGFAGSSLLFLVSLIVIALASYMSAKDHFDKLIEATFVQEGAFLSRSS